ncbi:MAG TPA: hypothetical protein VKK31_17695 [Thermoanaerobaculia bacterium]|nr:hypothetical protein [Thermoanaerobaculia bacterium]
MKRLVSVSLVLWISLLTSSPGETVIIDDPVLRCTRTGQLARRLCELQLENALLNVGGAAALACIGAFFIGNLAAAILCLAAFGVAAFLALNLYEIYQNCVEQAGLQEDVCIEVNCT